MRATVLDCPIFSATMQGRSSYPSGSPKEWIITYLFVVCPHGSDSMWYISFDVSPCSKYFVYVFPLVVSASQSVFRPI